MTAQPRACEPAPDPFDEGAVIAEIDALHRSLEREATSARERAASRPASKPRPELHDAQYAPVPLSEPERRLCSLYLRYASDGSREELRRELRHRHLELLMRLWHVEEGAEAAAAFVVDYPDHDLAVAAATMLVDALGIQWTVGPRRDEGRERLLEWIERLPTMPVWRHPKAEGLRERLPMLRVAALAARAKAARDADPPDYRACARAFDAALEPNIGQPIDPLLAGAADCLERAGDRAGAAARREELRRRVPDSPLAR